MDEDIQRLKQKNENNLVLFLEISVLPPAMGHVSQCCSQFLKSAVAEIKRVYKQVMDTLKVIHTEVLSMKICRPFSLQTRHIKKSLLKLYICPAIPMYKEGISTLSIASIKSY